MAYYNNNDWEEMSITEEDGDGWEDLPLDVSGGMAQRTYEPVEAEPRTLEPAEAPPYEEATVLGRAGDVGVDVARGVVGLGESFVGLAKMEPTGLLRKGFDAIGYDAGLTDEFLSDLYSDERKFEEAEVEDATGVVGTIKTLIKNPAAMAGQAVQMAPGMLSIMGAARVALARSSASAIAAASARGITDPKVLATIGRKAGAKAATITAAAAEGVQQTGTSFNKLIEDAETMGKAYTAAILSGAGTAAFAFLGGRLGQRLGLGDVEAGLAGEGGIAGRVGRAVGGKLGIADSKIAGRGARMVGGGVQEGLLEETPQSMQEQAWQNYATGRPLLEGVPEAGATGFVLGSVMGGGMSMASKPTKSPTDETDLLNTGMSTREEKQREKFMDDLLAGMESGEITPERMQAMRESMPESPLTDILDEFLTQAPEMPLAEEGTVAEPGVEPIQKMLPEELPAEQMEGEWEDVPVPEVSPEPAMPAAPSEKTDIALEGEAVVPPEAAEAIEPEALPTTPTPEEVAETTPLAQAGIVGTRPPDAEGRRKADRRKWETREDFERLLAETEDVEEARKLARQVSEKSYTDPLMGISNKAAWIEHKAKEDKLPPEQRQFKSVLDIDNFSWVNDVLGHDLGDSVLKQVGTILSEESGRPFRFGGEEFLIEGEDLENLTLQSEKIRGRLESEIVLEHVLGQDVTLEDGTEYKAGEKITVEGIGLSYGIDKDFKKADEALIADKGRRTEEGIRSPKGREIQRLRRELPGRGVEEGKDVREAEKVTPKEKIRKEKPKEEPTAEKIVQPPASERVEKKEQYATKTTFKDSDISLEDVKSIFKGQRVSKSPDGTIFVKTKLGKGVRIKSVEAITSDEIAFEAAYSREKLPNEDEKISGRYFDGVITISKVGDKWTLAHEAEHFLEESGFINKNDQKALRFEIKRRVKRGTWKSLNEDDIGGKEDRAEFIAKELKKRTDSKPTAQRVLQKIQDLIDAFVNLYKRTARGVTRDIETGKIYDKKQKALREGVPMFSVKGREQYTTKPPKDDTYVSDFLKKHGIDQAAPKKEARITAPVDPTDKPGTFQETLEPVSRGGYIKVIERYEAKLKAAETKLEKEKTAKGILQRRRIKIRAFADYFKLTDRELRQISRKDIRLMTDSEFKKHIDGIMIKAEKFEAKRQAMNELMTQIRNKELSVENLRKAMKLPTLKNMTVEQIKLLDETLEPFQKGDEFLSVRKLETVDRTELKGIKTWREARERLSKKLNVPIRELQKIRVSEFDRFRYDTGLAERNPFYRMMVEEPAKRMLISESEYLDIEKETFALTKKIKGSGFFIPQYKNIRAFMEASVEEKANIKLTEDELALANFMTKQFNRARDYLIQVEAMDMGKQNYFTHVRRGILEATKEDGIIEAIKEQFESYKLEEQGFNILDKATGEILAMDKFFKFAMHRTGKLKPTENITKAFLTYMRTFKKKQALDEIVPLIDIYAHALTPKGLTKKGLLLHGNLIKFVKEWLNTQKGRHITLVAKQNGKIDAALRAIKMFTSLRDLALNVPVSIATEVGEQITTYQLLGKKKFTLGKLRQNTKKGKEIIEKYRNLIGKNPWKELVEPSKAIGDRLMEGIFVLFRDASTRANKTFLLGSLSKAEFRSGEIDPERLASLRTELGRYRMVEGMKSVVGATPEGKAYSQYKKWAIPILRTTIKNLNTLGKKITFQKPDSKEFKKSALELYRLVEITAFAMLMFGMVRDEDDESFAGKIINKSYREATTLIQALQPSMFLTAGRSVSFATKLGVSLTLILQGEQYKTTGEYKGIKNLKRQFMPVAISQLAGETWDETWRRRKAKLNKVQDNLEKSKDKKAFWREHRDELVEIRQINQLQGKLNSYRKKINRLKSREETVARKKRIQLLESKRTSLIKNFLGRKKTQNRLNDFTQEYINIRSTGKSLVALKKSVAEFNRKQTAAGKRTISWSNIVKKGNRIRKAQK